MPRDAEASLSFGPFRLAREQQALAWELRAATSLARCVAGDRRNDNARIVLKQIYAQFSEGHDTPDLMATAALLERSPRP